MPRFDGTGPIGKGTLTGRGLGPCCDIREKNSNNKNEDLKDEVKKLQKRLKEVEDELKKRA